MLGLEHNGIAEVLRRRLVSFAGDDKVKAAEVDVVSAAFLQPIPEPLGPVRLAQYPVQAERHPDEVL